MLTINGVGTKFYGKNNEQSDGSYTTTEWFVFLMLPIIPIGSYRVIEHKRSSLIQTEYNIIEKLPLDKSEVARIYGIGIFCVVLFILFIVFAS